jgi:acetyl esterase/lipase
MFGIDPARIWAYGHSSGAPLAAMLGLRETRADVDPALAGYSSRVACVVELEGDMDLRLSAEADPAMAELSDAYLGGSVIEVPDVYRDASPVF